MSILRAHVEKILVNEWRDLQMVSEHARVLFCLNLQARLEGMERLIREIEGGVTSDALSEMDSDEYLNDVATVLDDLVELQGVAARLAEVTWRS